MSDRKEHPTAASGPTEPAPSVPPAAPAVSEPATAYDQPPPDPTAARYRELALGLGAALLVLAALVATAPLWAPLLPWGEKREAGAMFARIERLETAQQQLQPLERRIAALETRPAEMPPEFGEMRQRTANLSAGVADLAARLERLDKAVQAQAADLAQRLDALGQAARAHQSAAADLAGRVQALETAGRSRAGDLTDMALALALLQIRNAVEAGRPFAAEYDAFSALATARPEIAAAAAPLAGPARTGAAGRTVLASELRAMDRKVSAASPAGDAAGAERGWAGAALDRLRGLVTIRRIDDAEPRPAPESATRTAERAIAGGDLARAVDIVAALRGAPAEAAAPWLRMARERLAVEEALQRLEALLTARLGDTAAAPGSPG